MRNTRKPIRASRNSYRMPARRSTRVLAASSSVNKDEYWDTLVESGLVSEETLTVVTSILGYTVDTLDKVLYAVAGLRSYEDLLEELGE